MRRIICIILALGLSVSMFGQSKMALKDQTKPPGTNGQLLYNNNGVTDAEDPIVSYNYAQLIAAQSATGTSVGSPVRLSTFGGFGTLYVTFASITGSPSSCSVQLKNYDSAGNSLNNGAAISITAANGTSSFSVLSVAALATAAQMSATWACSVYPTTGTITVEYVPGISVGILTPLPTGSNVIGGVTQSGTWNDRISGNSGNAFDFPSTQNQATPAAAVLGGCQFNTSPTTLTTGNSSPCQMDSAGNALFNLKTPIPAGSNVVGKMGVDQTTPGTSNAVQSIAGSTGGATISFLAAAATTNATNVKNAAGTIYQISVSNTTATLYYLRMYNLAAAPTCSSATGFVETIPIPSSTSGGGRERNIDVGQAYATGIGFCITGGPTSTDNTAAAVGVFVTISYK